MHRPRPQNKQLVFPFARRPLKRPAVSSQKTTVHAEKKAGKKRKLKVSPKQQRDADIAYWKKIYARHDLAELEDAYNALSARIAATHPSQTKKRNDMWLQRHVVEYLQKKLKGQ